MPDLVAATRARVNHKIPWFYITSWHGKPNVQPWKHEIDTYFVLHALGSVDA